MMSKIWKIFGKGWYKTNFLSNFPRLNQRINLLCKYVVEFGGEWTEKVCETICWLIGKPTFSPWIENGVRFVNHEKKRKKKNNDFKKFLILWLRLLENHTVVISLFVEKKLPLEYLRWKKLLDEKQKEMSFMRATFLVLWKTFVEKDF